MLFFVCIKTANHRELGEAHSMSTMWYIDKLIKRKKNSNSLFANQESSLVNDKANYPSETAIIYRSEMDYMSRCILDYPSIETGGQLFGYWTSLGTPVVLYAIGPGPMAQHNPTSFFQDMEYLKSIGMVLYSKYRMQHIGEWHSHHQMDLARPSGGDVQTMQRGVGIPQFPRMLLCIGNCTPTETEINAFNFHENTPRDYTHARWDIVEMDSPYRKIVDAELQSQLIHPRTGKASYVASMLQQHQEERRDLRSHWLTEQVENVEEMKMFVQKTKTLSGSESIKTIMCDSGEPAISIADGRMLIKLPFGFPELAPVVLVTNKKGDDILDVDYKVVDIAARWDYPAHSLQTSFSVWIEDVINSLVRKNEHSVNQY